MFQGFSPETIEFLWGIRFNNEKKPGLKPTSRTISNTCISP